ncbi:hypothetical protein RJ640_007541 [Escallonia rubra]|uniref:S-adenosylmethionine-dependent methyltransferase n=1 Tax=Escallonia rubra TaxID=112253 RepID=A0AA88RI70_9ASTE|nr:hypothetical protein RJ640_007541 [Escallonia rubra]
MEEAIAMNGGDGPNSYTQNSKFQEQGSDRAKALLSNSIQEFLDIQESLQVFSIADLGCSVGPNTFSCVQTITKAVRLKYKAHSPKLEVPEFHVFFNDNVTNDFNTLFKALPVDRHYMAAGVPGSFYGRLFPKASMNFIHSSYSLHWLTKVPEEVLEEASPACNKGRITYVLSSCEVVKAFTSQFLSDMEAFFSARSLEMERCGLMALLIPCRPEGTLPSDSIFCQFFECLSGALKDLVKEGLVTKALVDSFNLPIYIPDASELKKAITSNKHLELLKMEEVYFPPMLTSPEEVLACSRHVRAAMEGILCNHFGSQIMDQLFEKYSEKLEEFSKMPHFIRVKNLENLFVLVKRNSLA